MRMPNRQDIFAKLLDSGRESLEAFTILTLSPSCSLPCRMEVDGDGDVDLVLGSRDGTLVLYEGAGDGRGSTMERSGVGCSPKI